MHQYVDSRQTQRFGFTAMSITGGALQTGPNIASGVRNRYRNPSAGCLPNGRHRRFDKASRDERWFADLYRRTIDSAYRYAVTVVKDRHAAEDVVAEAYLRAWLARASFDGRSAMTSWLIAIIHNCAIDFLRSRRQHISLDFFDGADRFPGADSAPEGMTLVELVAIRDAVAQLSAEQQQVIFLRFYQQLSGEAVAAVIGKSPAAVRQIQFRAFIRLRELLQVNRTVARRRVYARAARPPRLVPSPPADDAASGEDQAPPTASGTLVGAAQ